MFKKLPLIILFDDNGLTPVMIKEKKKEIRYEFKTHGINEVIILSSRVSIL